MTIKHTLFGLATSLVVAGGAANAASVSLELMLLTDVSGSVSSSDYNLIREGYARAFEDVAVQNNILNSATGSIAVATSQFASSYFGITTSWTLIDSVAAANSFATTLRTMGRAGTGGTGIAAGITGAAAEFASNSFDGLRQVIDLAGDGSQSEGGCSGAVCLPLQMARDAALLGETDTINALFVNDRTFFGDTGTEAVDSILYGNTNVIGGAGAFVVSASGFDDFSTAIRDKIIREIAPPAVPVPAAGLLMVAGLGGLGALRRRKSKS